MRQCRKSVSFFLSIGALAAIAWSHAQADDSGLQLPAHIDVDRYRSSALPPDAAEANDAVSVGGPVRKAIDAARSTAALSSDGRQPTVSTTSDQIAPKAEHRASSASGEPLRLPLFVALRETPPAAAAVGVVKKSEKKSAAPAKLDPPAVAAPPALPELSAEMAAFRDRVRSTLTAYFQQSLNTHDNNVSDILQVCLAFGCETEVLYGTDKLNGITCLCWNYPCGEYQPLTVVAGHITARVGYGVQTDPAQLLGVLALSRVPISYPTRVGSKVGTVANLVEFEKLSCRAGVDQSFRLIGLTYYAAAKDSWKNDLGEPWSLERMVREELDRPDAESSVAGVNRLLGLSYATGKLGKLKGSVGDLGRAKRFLDDYRQFALGLQNSDGTWHPRFFAAVGSSRDWEGTLAATAHIFEWLTIASSVDQLESTEMIRSANYLTTLLANQSTHWNAAALSAKDLDAVMHALHGLNVYDERVFKPHDAKKVEGAEKKADAEKPAAANKDDAAK
jgi:hypothetical protein